MMRFKTMIVMIGIAMFTPIISLSSVCAQNESSTDILLPSPTNDVTRWILPGDQSGPWMNPKNWSNGSPSSTVAAEITNGGTAVLGNELITVIAQASSLQLGRWRDGALKQVGNALWVSNDVQIGQSYLPGVGSYHLSAGSLRTNSLLIDVSLHVPWILSPSNTPNHWRNNTFYQMGGNVEVASMLQVGHLTPPPFMDVSDGLTEGSVISKIRRPHWRQALYHLSDGNLTTKTTLVGSRASGQFLQTGGTHTAKEGIYVGGFAYFINPVPIPMAMESNAFAPIVPIVPIVPINKSHGSYQLFDGVINTSTLVVGHQGYGQFNQVGGRVNVEGRLRIGGENLWVNQPASDIVESNALSVGHTRARGTYILRSGNLTTAGTDIGINSDGRFVQTGGVHSVKGTLRVGDNRLYWHLPTMKVSDTNLSFMPPDYHGNGHYLMYDGDLKAERIEIYGQNHWHHYPWLKDNAKINFLRANQPVKSVFTQRNGSVKVAGDLFIRSGYYLMQGGRLETKSMSVMGEYKYKTAQFTQTGGTVVTGKLNLGSDFWITNALAPVDMPIIWTGPGVAHYQLSKGVLSAGNIRLMGGQRSQLMQTGGLLKVASQLAITGNNASYILRRGKADVSTIKIGYDYGPIDLINMDPTSIKTTSRIFLGGSDTSLRLTSQLITHPTAQLDAQDGSRILMDGADFINQSYNPVALEGLDHLSMIYTIGAEDDLAFEMYEVAGKDLGHVRAGWYKNFQLMDLQIGSLVDVGELKLVNQFGNQPLWRGREALYVRNLSVTAGSSLDLNGINLYFLTATISPDATILNGNLIGGSADGAWGMNTTSVPEPSVLVLMGLGSLVLAWRHPRLRSRRQD